MEVENIKKLREQTGAGFGDCKKAIEEASGDFDKALELLKKRAVEVAEKKSSRNIKSGVIEAYIHAEGKIGVLIKAGCETDFVAKNDDFKNIIHDIAIHIAAMNPDGEEDLFAQPFVKNPEITVKDFLQEAVIKIGENIKIEQFSRFEI